jgi:protein N-terminal amidase
MKLACLQFAPEVGKVQENIARADSILLEAQLPFDIDWLILPELAFTGKQAQSSVRHKHVTLIEM